MPCVMCESLSKIGQRIRMLLFMYRRIRSFGYHNGMIVSVGSYTAGRIQENLIFDLLPLIIPQSSLVQK